jgi:hypothetical protein
MINRPSKFAVTYGISDAEEILKTVFVASAKDVKAMARRFITCFPADPADFVTNVDEWDGTSVFDTSFEDDERFFFQATPIPATLSSMSDFDAFISEYARFEDD